jgi:hypothetical protein
VQEALICKSQSFLLQRNGTISQTPLMAPNFENILTAEDQVNEDQYQVNVEEREFRGTIIQRKSS